MNNVVARNIFHVVISALAGLCLSYFLNRLNEVRYPFYGWVVLYFSVVFFISNLIYAHNRQKDDFVAMLLSGIVVRLLLCLVVIVIYMVSGGPLFFAFAIHFIAHYILFTIVEIRYLRSLIKPHKT
jgi:hypothetical protein